MKNTRELLPAQQGRIIGSCFALAFTLMIGSASPVNAAGRDGYAQGGPARQDHGQRHQRQDKNWNNHEMHARRYWNQPYFEPEPSVVYAPPLIYSPPPEYAEPGIRLIFPLHIR